MAVDVDSFEREGTDGRVRPRLVDGRKGEIVRVPGTGGDHGTEGNGAGTGGIVETIEGRVGSRAGRAADVDVQGIGGETGGIPTDYRAVGNLDGIAGILVTGNGTDGIGGSVGGNPSHAVVLTIDHTVDASKAKRVH